MDVRVFIELSVGSVEPAETAVLRAMGFGAADAPSEKIRDLVAAALGDFRRLGRPRGLLQGVSPEEFRSIYAGEGRNEPATPLQGIFPRATHMALFAVTVGSAVSQRVEDLFAEGEFALGYVLDRVASEAAEGAADRMEERLAELLADKGELDASSGHLRYSPGYCGWHVSGQKKLFARLRPEAVGIGLNASFLMQPLKSVSGVIVLGKKAIHVFKASFPFCARCATESCRDRLKHLMSPDTDAAQAAPRPTTR